MEAQTPTALPTDSCRWCGERIRSKAVTVRDGERVFHKGCWPTALEAGYEPGPAHQRERAAAAKKLRVHVNQSALGPIPTIIVCALALPALLVVLGLVMVVLVAVIAACVLALPALMVAAVFGGLGDGE